MATNWLYVPVLGDYSAEAIGFFANNTFETFPRDPQGGAQGDPRPGSLKWVFHLNNSNPTTHATDQTETFLLVKTPFPNVTPVDENQYLPVLSVLSVGSVNAIDQKVFAFTGNMLTPAQAISVIPALAGVLNVNYLYAVVNVKVPAPAGAAISFQLMIDFSHSSIN